MYVRGSTPLACLKDVSLQGREEDTLPPHRLGTVSPSAAVVVLLQVNAQHSEFEDVPSNQYVRGRLPASGMARRASPELQRSYSYSSIVRLRIAHVHGAGVRRSPGPGRPS